MRLWRARSKTYKTHLVSSLCRSLFTNIFWIFATSLYVKCAGGKSYSQLFCFASLCSLLFYTYFSFRGEKKAYIVYKATIMVALLASVGCFLEPFCSVLQPFNQGLLCVFVVAVMTVDLIGTTLGPIVLQASVNPAIFREVYQNIITTEVMARIAAAALVWLLSLGHLLVYLYPLGWILLIAHYLLFGITLWRMRVAQLKAPIPSEARVDLTNRVFASLRFIFGNPLVRVAMIVLLWSTVTKFTLEYVFYQVADATFGSARQVASFLSITTIVMYVLSLVVHHFIGRTLTSRLQLSTILSFQPINVVVLGGLALLVPPFWPLVVLMVTYNILHRSIQLPVSRQCLVPVPRQERGTIVSLICIVVSIGTLLISGGMAAFQKFLHLQDFLVFLIVLGVTIFFVVTGLDSYYIRNLWSLFRELRSGSWQDEPQPDNLAPAELDSDSSIDDLGLVGTTADLKCDPILETYACSYDHAKLWSATKEHRQLLRSRQGELLVFGLRICFISGFPWFAQLLAESASHDDERVRTFAQRVQRVNSAFANLQGYSSIFRRRLKAVALELLDEGAEDPLISKLSNLVAIPLQTPGCSRERLQSDSGSTGWSGTLKGQVSLSAAKKLTRTEDEGGSSKGAAPTILRSDVDSIVAALADVRFKGLRTLVLSCIGKDRRSGVTVSPVIEKMYEIEYAGACDYRHLLQELSFGKNDSTLRKTISEKLANLKRDGFSPGHRNSQDRAAALQTFMHTLFLEEYRLCPHEDRALIDTIEEFQTLSVDESAVLIDMHLSFLKRSELLPSWRALMS